MVAELAAETASTEIFAAALKDVLKSSVRSDTPITD